MAVHSGTEFVVRIALVLLRHGKILGCQAVSEVHLSFQDDGPWCSDLNPIQWCTYLESSHNIGLVSVARG